jgi:hypothetical protein
MDEEGRRVALKYRSFDGAVVAEKKRHANVIVIHEEA